MSGTVVAEQHDGAVLPLPGDAFPRGTNPLVDLANRFVGTTGDLHFELPDSLVIENQGGDITYDSEKKTVHYNSNGRKIRLRADTGLDVEAESLVANMAESTAVLDGPISVYQGEMLSRARNGVYNWSEKKMTAEDFRTKANGLLIRGEHAVYATDAKGKQYVCLQKVRVSTDDVEKPSVWLRAKELKVYPGDIGKLTGLGVDWGVVSTPGLGITLTHSLNPEEGYMPIPGSRGIWGTYLLNRYGFLIGNRRVENGMPVADYILTTRLDLRTRRGVAAGLDFKDCSMYKKYDMPGLSLYYIDDLEPSANPTRRPRKEISSQRYRMALETTWDLPTPGKDKGAKWSAMTNINMLSDQYVLRDFFEELSSKNDKPDNTMRLERRTKSDHFMLWSRFAPNDFYATDQRVELNHYHVRSAIGNSRFAYEGRSGIGVISQYIPDDQKLAYKKKLEQIKDNDQKAYYTRMLNTSVYVRANSTHEISTAFKLFNVLNVTPKAGVGYSGYYGVEGVGDDHRFTGYLGCNFDIKFHRRFEKVTLPWMDGRGLTHVVRPYVNASYCNVTSSNPLVPKVDVWSTTLSNSSNNPMALDLLGFTNIDSWGTWSIFRMGIVNNLTTKVDGEKHNLLSWNCFIDYNARNPNTQDSFSNLFSVVSFRPSKHLTFRMQAQTPVISGGDGFKQYNTSVTLQPCSWFEGSLGHSYINGHPLIQDANQVYIRATLRASEKWSFACRVDWDIRRGRMPIQQFGAFHKWGPWYVGGSVFLRNNGGRKETGFGISFTLTETGTGLPLEFM